MTGFWQDLRHAIRSLRRTPTFTATAIATLALALGLNAAVFAVVNAYVLRPAAVQDPDSLYLFTWSDRTGRGHSFTWDEYQQVLRDNAVFSKLFAGRKQLVTRLNGHPVYGQLVTGDYFSMLGIGAALGRTLMPRDMPAPGREPVVVLSFQAWQRIFARDPAIVGKTVLVRGQACTVIGVMPDGFTGLDLVPHDFWAPLTLAGALDDGTDLFAAGQPGRLELIGRLKPELTERIARAALMRLAQRMTADRPEQERAAAVLLIPAGTAVPLSAEVMLAILPVAVAFSLVLAVACANVVSLMLARALAQRRELALRLALGATRAQVMRFVLAESLVLASVASAAGFAIAQVTIELGLSVLFATLPNEYVDYVRLMPLQADLRTLVFMLAAALAAGLLSGIVPAVQSTRGNLTPLAPGATDDHRSVRLRHSLVVAEITVCVVLLICAGVLLQGANRIGHRELGFRTDKILEIRTREQTRTRVLAALRDAPTVAGVAAASHSAFEAGSGIAVTGTGENRPVPARYRLVSPEYFTILELQLLGGRAFNRNEARAAAPVAIVSEATARRVWPGRSAIGQSLRVSVVRRTPSAERAARYGVVEVVGVVHDAATGYAPDDAVVVYLPTSTEESGTLMLVSVRGDTEQARRSLEATLATVEPGAVDEMHRIDEYAAGLVYPFRVAYWLSAAIGVLALILTMSGLYGALSYLVAHRTREIGIRIALGASVAGVIGLVMRQSLKMILAGITVGTLLAFGVARLLASSLVMINTFEAGAYLAAMAVVASACLAAAYRPARRAATIQPVVALRAE